MTGDLLGFFLVDQQLADPPAALDGKSLYVDGIFVVVHQDPVETLAAVVHRGKENSWRGYRVVAWK